MQPVSINYTPYIKLRIFATLIDYGIYFIFYSVYLSVFDENPKPGTATVTGWMALPPIIFWFIYFLIPEAADQATFGHWVVKLKVYKINGAKPSLGDAFKRRLLDPIDILFYGIPAIICIKKTPRHQRLGDLVADTVVVKQIDVSDQLLAL